MMMLNRRNIHNLSNALEAVFLNRTRSLLTALGIIFGVAAVIAMMAIGNGARQEILEQIKLVGLNNILITPKQAAEEESGEEEGKEIAMKYSPGLTLRDAEGIRDIIPNVLHISPEINYETFILKDGRRMKAMIGGVTNDFFSVYSLPLAEGRSFSEMQITEAMPVCIIGAGIRGKFFAGEDAVGKFLKCGHLWLQVIGVLQQTGGYNPVEGMGINDHNQFIYAPVSTILLRYYDRSLITAATLRGESTSAPEGVATEEGETGNNQLDKIVVQATESRYVGPVREAIDRMLLRRHMEVRDFEVKVPESLLKQEQKTRDIFNIVLGSIAGIALLVGGIGIMNIMLASVLERIREIGIRMAMGARRKDIIFQFLSESTMISLSGGFLGILLGIAMAAVITRITGIPTIISLWSILVSFGVSATVGIVFGYAPARRAARQNPVASLRYE
jgi:putative ABC transport system permease protein